MRKDLAAPQGFEPRYPAPEAGVLPLNEGAVTPHYPMSSKAGQIPLKIPQKRFAMFALDSI